MEVYYCNYWYVIDVTSTNHQLNALLPSQKLIQTMLSAVLNTESF